MADEQNLDTQNPEAQAAENVAPSDDLAARVQALEEQLAAAQDQSLRMAAELQNVRRRAEQDVEKAHKFALEKFANDLLPVVDSLERGLEPSSPDDEAIKGVREGMQLTLKLFIDTLARHQLETLDPHGARSTRSITRPWRWKRVSTSSRTRCSRCSRRATCSTAACCARPWSW